MGAECPFRIHPQYDFESCYCICCKPVTTHYRAVQQQASDSFDSFAKAQVWTQVCKRGNLECF
jgi:hypothetical protein